ncbi:MAG: hypothetical protein HQ471_00360 [Flavobacteriales bacterium]|nr:hypothetical protein [Flavobacteriales bacterium]
MANNKGWISLHRQFEEHWLWNEKRVFSKAEAWIDILMTTNHSPQKVVIKNALYTVKRGESLLSLKSWGLRWKWEKSKVRRFLDTLEKDEMITTKNETQTTRLIVCNYDNYQTLGNAKETVVKPKITIIPKTEKPKDITEYYRKFAHLKLSLKDFDKLRLKYSKVQIDNILDRIENYSKNKSYKSLYLTANTWLSKDVTTIKGLSAIDNLKKALNG